MGAAVTSSLQGPLGLTTMMRITPRVQSMNPPANKD
jgi:hypothetical protein